MSTANYITNTTFAPPLAHKQPIIFLGATNDAQPANHLTGLLFGRPIDM